LEKRAEDSKNLAARTVTTVSARAFRNASQASQTLAPQGLLSKLVGSINQRFHRSSPSPDASAAPTTGEGSKGGGGVGGSDASAARGTVRPAPNGARRSPSPQAPASTMVRAGKGAGRRAVSSSAQPPSGPTPPLAERTVKGILTRVFPSRDEAAKNSDVDVGGVDVKASAAEQQAHHQPKKRSEGTDNAVKVVARKARGWGAQKRAAGARETETFSPEAVASADSNNSRNKHMFSRFGRPNQDAGKSKSASPPPSASSAENDRVTSGGAGVAQAPNRNSSGGKVGRGWKGSLARDARKTHLSAAPVAVAEEAVIPTAVARPEVHRSPDVVDATTTTSNAVAVGSTEVENEKLRGEKKVVAPKTISGTPPNSPEQHSLGRGGRRRRRRHRRRRSEKEIEEELRWPDIDVAESTDNNDSTVMNGIRAHWAKLVCRSPPRADRSDDSTVNAGDDIAKNDDGDASSVTEAAAAPRRLFGGRFRGWFRKERDGLETGKEDVDDDVLDMVGLGA
ncbi:unnamed protein product, partial [Ectocarpus sp. 8 AP-2014]